MTLPTTPPPNLSDEALRFLERPASARDRSAVNLPAMRENALKLALAKVPRLCRAHRVRINETMRSGVRCLEVVPEGPLVDWRILFGFGGGMVEGSPEEDLPIIAPLCALTGAQIIVPDYRLAPEYPWPAAVEDGLAVYREIADRPFASVGESAGANLTLAWMLRAKSEGLRLPNVSALLSPWCDLVNAGDSLKFNEGRDPTLSLSNSFLAANYYAGKNNLGDPTISPIYGEFDADFGPFLVTTGTRDLLLSQSVRLAQKLRDSGRTVDLDVWDGLWHVFEWYEDLPEAAQSIGRIAAHLTRHMVGR